MYMKHVDLLEIQAVSAESPSTYQTSIEHGLREEEEQQKPKL
jgi:hypothetical protein